MSLKIERLESSFVKEISYILMEEVKDEDIRFVTITGCDITNDLSFAKVYFTVLDMNKKNLTIKALDRAKSFIRGELSKRIDMRHTPELTFIFDESIEYGNKIEKIIDKINNEEKNNQD
ncbi:MAG: 30S ribosome-binding factor RbfA [bacterium]|nr:30S ribosome-binding factor RbfA [bacterium]